MAKVTMPQLGESVAEGTIGKWLKQPGDHVDKYEPLLEVITDKVNAEVPSPFEGVLKEILAEEGATVPNDAEIAIIDTGDEARRPGRDGDPSRPPSPTPAPEPASGPAGSDERPAAPTPAPAPAASAPAGPARPRPLAPAATPAPVGDADARMTPAVRRLLREHGLSPEQIAGTGGGGRITRDDVLAVVEQIRTGRRAGRAGHAAPASSPECRRRPPRPRRVARRSRSPTARTRSSCR